MVCTSCLSDKSRYPFTTTKPTFCCTLPRHHVLLAAPAPPGPGMSGPATTGSTGLVPGGARGKVSGGWPTLNLLRKAATCSAALSASSSWMACPAVGIRMSWNLPCKGVRVKR